MDDPWALTIHAAGHAVMVIDLGLRLQRAGVSIQTGQCRVRYRQATSPFAELSHGDPAIRCAVETDVMVTLAGVAAESIYKHDAGTPHRHVEDQQTAERLLSALEDDPAVVMAWTTYLRERARAVLDEQARWARVTALAAAFFLQPNFSASEIDRLPAGQAGDVRAWKGRPLPPVGVTPRLLRPVGEVLPLSSRSLRILEQAGIVSAWELMRKSDRELLSHRGLGRKTFAEISEALALVRGELDLRQREPRSRDGAET